MGLLRAVIGQTIGGDRIQNGFGGPQIPFGDKLDRIGRNRVYNFSRISHDSPREDYRSSNGVVYRQHPRDFELHGIDSSLSYSRNSVRDVNYDLQTGVCDNESLSSDLKSTNRTQPFSYSRDDGIPYPSAHPRDSRASREDYYTGDHAYPYGPTERAYNRGFRPLALPQIYHGDGEPFLRGYSDDLYAYGISRDEFISIVDSINVAVIPNPEVQIFQKGASIAGWFIPGSASLGLMAGQLGVGVAAAFGHTSLINRELSKANLCTFLPQGLEICIGKARDLDAELGISGSSQISYGAGPAERLAFYNNLLAPISEVLPKKERVGRQDPIAMLGKGISQRSNQKKAEKRMGKRKSGRAGTSDSGLKWLIVREASAGALQKWEQVSQQAELDIRKQAATADEQSRVYKQ